MLKAPKAQFPMIVFRAAPQGTIEAPSSSRRFAIKTHRVRTSVIIEQFKVQASHHRERDARAMQLTTPALMMGHVKAFLRSLKRLGHSFGLISAASRNRSVASSHVSFLTSSLVNGFGSLSCSSILSQNTGLSFEDGNDRGPPPIGRAPKPP